MQCLIDALMLVLVYFFISDYGSSRMLSRMLWRYIIHVQAFIKRHILSNSDSCTKNNPVAVYWIPRFWYYYFIINILYLLNRLHGTQLSIHVNWFSNIKKNQYWQKTISFGTIQSLHILPVNIKKTMNQMFMQNALPIFSPKQWNAMI